MLGFLPNESTCVTTGGSGGTIGSGGLIIGNEKQLTENNGKVPRIQARFGDDRNMAGKFRIPV